jgi:hypothetical protein
MPRCEAAANDGVPGGVACKLSCEHRDARLLLITVCLVV